MPPVNDDALSRSLMWYFSPGSNDLLTDGEGDLVTTAFGARLRRFRQAKGYTMEQLAEKVDVSKSYIWALENNPDQRELRTSATVMSALARELGVTIQDLMGEAPPAELGKKAEPEDVKFFRNYMRMAPEDRENYRKMLDLFSKSKGS
jgi:transcriptional regulator with XRE-family HTH domain